MDLGGVAKGYAVDRAVQALRSHGIERALVNAGGDIYAMGTPEDEEGWRIGIQHPCDPRKLAAAFRVRDQAVATSGNYENAVSVNGERIGHLFDPHSGRPANPILSATVVAPSAMEADALATASFLMAEKDSRSFVNSHPRTAALLIASESMGRLTMSATAGFPNYSA
jgi:thiamine biosynthesis lipoprotein